MSRGGSRRGGDRGSDFAQAGPDGWAVAGGSGGPPRTKAGDLTNFGKIAKAAPMTFGPSSVFAGKKDVKRESLSRTNSSSNMFLMLSQNPEVPVDPSASKSSRPPSRKTSVDLSQSGQPEPQRKKLQLLPRSKPTVEEEAPPVASSEASEDELPTESLFDAEAQKRMEEDSKEFFGVRNLDEAEVYFTNLPNEHRFQLVEKLVMSALESKDSDAQLVAEFFDRAVTKELCAPSSFDEGFLLVADSLDDVAIDAPKAFNLMAIMLKGAGIDKDEERRTRIASKSETPDRLLDMLA
jgi:translation initiation factor 4G